MKLNPIINKELKSSSRSIRFPIMITVFLLILLFFKLVTSSSSYGFDTFNYASYIRNNVTSYTSLIIIELVCILFIVPSLCSSSISGERERQTLDLLLVTKLSPTSIIIGKLFSSLSRVLLLIVISIPIFASVMNIIGISFLNIFYTLIFSLSLAIFVGSVSIMFSSLFKKTTLSTILSYGFVLFILIFPFIIVGIGSAFISGIVYKNGGNIDNFKNLIQIAYIVLSLNPIASMSSLLSSQFGVASNGTYTVFNMFSSLSNGLGVNPIIPLWVISIIINLLFSVLFLFISIKKLNPIKKK